MIKNLIKKIGAAILFGSKRRRENVILKRSEVNIIGSYSYFANKSNWVTRLESREIDRKVSGKNIG